VDYIRDWCDDHKDWTRAKEIIIPKLTQFANIPDVTLKRFTDIPTGYRVRKGRMLPRLLQFRNAARRLAAALQALQWR
jgi:hypothetical protein